MFKNHRATTRALGLATLTGIALAGAPAALAATHAPDDSGGWTAVPEALSAVSSHDVADGLDYIKLYPLAGGPLDLLSNTVRVPVGGAQLSTFPITAPFHDGLPLREVPIVHSLLP
ncbi:hypothetical protein GCM10009839_86800 [Catenulispora yoronensis]|uniref:Uncharacterized protein n=1 Tax=Catenulispora yoronensis TaxID=450799 RepID=A0ABP5H0Y3_9ACTN